MELYIDFMKGVTNMKKITEKVGRITLLGIFGVGLYHVTYKAYCLVFKLVDKITDKIDW